MYYNPQIEVLSSTQDPAKLVYSVARDSMVNRYVMKEGAESVISSAGKLVQYLYRADHGEPLRFPVLSCRVTGVSRAFMSQIRTWKHMSCVCSSQHYQDYRLYPSFSRPECAGPISAAMQNYTGLIDQGLPVYEARMVLPEAMAVTINLSANAQAWAYVIRRRLCLRNVPEMVIWATRMRQVLINWFPELFNWVNAACEEDKCREGFLTCKLSSNARQMAWVKAFSGEVY